MRDIRFAQLFFLQAEVGFVCKISSNGTTSGLSKRTIYVDFRSNPPLLQKKKCSNLAHTREQLTAWSTESRNVLEGKAPTDGLSLGDLNDVLPGIYKVTLTKKIQEKKPKNEAKAQEFKQCLTLVFKKKDLVLIQMDSEVKRNYLLRGFKMLQERYKEIALEKEET